MFANIKVNTILATLQLIVDPDMHTEVERIRIFGAPALCNVSASEANLHAYLKYENHQSIIQNQPVFE